jgi:hypothetical protein
MPKAKTISEIRALSIDDLIKEHDQAAASTVVGTNFYLDELRARDSQLVARKVEKLTLWIFILTLIVTAATIANLALFYFQQT